MPKRKDKNWIHRVTYVCQLCDPHVEVPTGTIKQHLAELHDYDPDHMKALTQHGVKFLDGSGFYSNTYEIRDGEKVIGLKIASGETIRKEDPEHEPAEE